MTRPPTEPPGRAAQATGFVLFTTPIPLCNLDADSQTCPICAETYKEPEQTRPSPDSTDEWAMRVDMSATEEGATRCCRHIFGRRCLEKHINSRGAWRNKCPLCRQTWWVEPPTILQPISSGSTTTARRTHSGRVLRRGGSGSRSQDLAPRRRSHFVQRVLNTFSVAEGSEQVDATVQEVEQRLADLYQDLGQQRDRNEG